MKKFKYVLLIVLAIILISAVALGIWQKDNLVSFVNTFRFSEDELATKLKDNNKQMEDLVNKTEYIDIRNGGLTAEEESALRNNEISVEDAIKIIRGQTSLEQIKSGETATTPANGQAADNTANNKQPDNSAANESNADKEEIMKDNVSNIVAELYVVKSDFLAKLNDIGMKAYEDYKAKGGNKSVLPSIVESYTPTAGALETECDNKINQLLGNLENELKKGGGDLSLVNEIRQYYYNEKSLTKSYYLNKYVN